MLKICAKLLLVLAGCGWFWLVVSGFGWLWVVLAGCGWLSLVVGGFGCFGVVFGWLWVVLADLMFYNKPLFYFPASKQISSTSTRWLKVIVFLSSSE